MIKILVLFLIITFVAFNTVNPETIIKIGNCALVIGALVLFAAVLMKAKEENQTNS